MSKYTTELRYIIESGFKLSLDSYPIFDEAYREGLNQKIINHFYFREIGFESVPLFNFYLKRKMNEIMPMFNQLYMSTFEKLNIDPFASVDLHDVTTRTTTGNSQSTQNATSSGTSTNIVTNSGDNLNLETDTPQGSLTDAEIRNNKYISKANRNNINETHNTTDNQTGTQNQTGENTQTSSESVDHHTYGNSMGYTNAQQLSQYRETFLNIDMDIINALEDLFMQIY